MRSLVGTLLALLSLVAASTLASAQKAASAADGLSDEAAELLFGGDPETGWQLFRSKNCIACHGVWGQGGHVGPDLGRVRAGEQLTAGLLAGTMWNHVPRMWETMEQQNIRFTPISAEEMSHLFAFLVFIRYVDEPGNADRGGEVLRRYRCPTCHAIAGEGGAVGPDLERWARFVNPIVWAQKMWAHAPEMEAEMRAQGIGWPTFEPGDLVDIIAYIRSRGIGEGKEYLEPGSASRGREVFEERGCSECHEQHLGGGEAPDLDLADLPPTLAGIASAMWNHAPQMQRAMRAKGREATEIEAQEMADVIAYLQMRRYFLPRGDARAGARLFVAKGCSQCHRLGDTGGEVGPELTGLRTEVTPVLMAHVMWTHGPTMLTEMTRRGVPWPSFSGTEMEDLITFLGPSGLVEPPTAGGDE